MEKEDFNFIEENAVDAPVKDIHWHGKEIQTDATDLWNDGSGDKIILRTFVFQLNPTLERPPVKEEILTPQYIKSLQVMLWADELRMAMEPKVHIEKDKFTVFVPCVPKAGAVILETPKLVQELASAT